jgi:hypothetical protein
MGCPECDWLLAEYERRKGNHALALQTLNALRDTATVTEYKGLRDGVDKAASDLEAARLKFERHGRAHPKAPRTGP